MGDISTKSKKLLTNNDLRTLSIKLELLNSYKKESLSKTKNVLEFWKKRAVEFGENSFVDEQSNRTYSDMINNTLNYISLIESEITENNLLIEKIYSTLDHNLFN